MAYCQPIAVGTRFGSLTAVGSGRPTGSVEDRGDLVDADAFLGEA
jgi:hypothetical protein